MMIIVIPAYQPDKRMLKLIFDLRTICECKIIVVNDGSSKQCNAIFKSASELGAVILKHEKNEGKGAALKTAFKFIKKFSQSEDEIVTCDCDGQHLPHDILRTAAEIKNNENSIILGSRHFSNNVPFKSSFGNKFTSLIFFLTTGIKLSDTQTGLRGFSSKLLDYLSSLKGSRYEYEMNMLLEAQKHNIAIKEIPIKTIYINNNKGSHFNPLVDSLKIYMPILKFSISSISSALIDFFLLLILKFFTSNLFLAVSISRISSASFNYTINKKYIFKYNNYKNSLYKYIILAFIIMILNYLILNSLYSTGLNLVCAKILTECFLFAFSFILQRNFVFKNI